MTINGIRILGPVVFLLFMPLACKSEIKADYADGRTSGGAGECIDPDLSKIMVGVEVRLCDDTVAVGTYEPPVECEEDGEQDCVTTGNFKAVDTSSLASKVKEGEIVAGVSGSVVPSPDLSNLTADNIKSGVEIAGVEGTFAGSGGSACSSDGEQDCVASGSYFAATGCNSAGDQSCYATGTYYAAENCASDGDQDCYSTGSYYSATACNTGGDQDCYATGSYKAGTDCTSDGDTDCVATAGYPSVDSSEIDSGWNVRVGSTLGGVAGKLKANCGNAADTFVFDNITSPAVGGLDIWDTIDDHNDGGLFSDLVFPAAWDSTTQFCDATNWEDVSRDGGTGGDNNCDEAVDDCVFKDKISGLLWTEENPGNATWDFSTPAAGDWPCGSASCTQTNGNVTAGGGSGVYTAGENLFWWDALYACEHLGDTGNFGGYTDWRLPTQKELMDSYVHGIRDLEDANFIPDAAHNFWSSSTGSDWLDGAYIVDLGGGYTANQDRTDTYYRILCVR